MAAELNDVVRIIVSQTQNGQTVQNVFWYRVVAATGLAYDYLEVVRDWMLNEVLPPIWNLQSDGLVYVTMNIQNVTNGIDFLDHVFSPTEQPANTGDYMPPFVTYTFRLLRETLATRHGYKRFAGVREVNVANGVSVLNPVDYEPVEDALGADIQPAPSLIPLLEPVIVRRSTAGTIVAVNSVSAGQYRGIGTQNTRKIGRGS